MKELAISNQSLYTGYKGIKAMPEGVSSAETRRSLEADIGRAVVKETKAKVRNEQREKKQELLRKLEREKRAASRRRKATEQLEPPKPKAAQVVERKPIIPTKENPVIVESYPHFENSTREQVVETLEAQNVRIEVPNEEEWKKMGALGRRRWIQRNGIENVVKLPDEPTVFEDKETGSRVSVENDGRVFIQMKEPKVLKEDTLNSLLARAGSNIRVSYSGLVDAKDPQKVKDLLKEYGVSIIPEIAGGAVVYTDTNTVTNPRELYKRLDRLDVDEQTMGTAAFLASGRGYDRWEILERFRSEDVEYPEFMGRDGDQVKEWHIQDALTRLRGLQSMERTLGLDDFSAVGLGENRREVQEKLIRYGGSEAVIKRLFEFSGLPPGQLTVIQADERGALRKALADQINRARNINTEQRGGFMFVNNLARTVETQEILAKAAGQLDRLNSFLPQATRNGILKIRKNLDQHFLDIKRSIGANVEARLFESFDNPVKTLESQLQLGMTLGEFEFRLYEAAIRAHELPGHEGILEWRAAQILDGYQSQLERGRFLGVPDYWGDSLRNVNYNLRFIESVEFTPEELSSARNRLVGISESLSQRIHTLRDPDEIAQAEAMLREVNEVKDSVLAFYEARIAMETSAMDPEKILPHFESLAWKDNTFLVYFRRFYKDHLGEEFTDRNGVFNMLDRGMQVIFAKLRQEKQTMNLVEGLSIVDIATPFAAGDERYEWIEDLLGRSLSAGERAQLEVLRQEFYERVFKFRTENDLGDGTPAHPAFRDLPDTRPRGSPPPEKPGFIPNKQDNINSFWANPFAAKDIVSQWYRENMILGAHGYRVGDNEHQYLDQRKEDLRGELEELLRTYGVSQELIDEYRDQGLFTQIVNNSYSMATVLGAFSDYDGIRLWDRKSVWFRDRSRGDVPRLGAFVYNTATSLYTGRMVDHYGEFLIDEVRGRPRDVNHEFTKFMLGKKRGVLGNNRLLVKFTADILDDTRNFNKEFKDRLVVDGSGRSFRDVLTNKIVNLEGVEKLNFGERVFRDGDYYNDGGEFYDRIWARGAAIEELIEGGEISFEKLEFSKLFENEKTNIIRYNMQDWWDDRNGTKKYFDSGAMQEYLKNPGTRFFFKMNREIFYSKREVRIQPWMKLVIPAHQEIGKHWQEWWKLPYDMPHAETKRVIDEAVRLNMLDYRYRDVLENQLLGWGPFSGSFLFGRVKALRYLLETVDRNVREFGKQDWELLFFWPLEFFRVVGQQSFAQLAGK